MFLETYLFLQTFLGQPQVDKATPAATSVQTVKAPSATELVGKVQAFYQDNKQLTAKFRQVYTNTTFGKESVSSGNVWLKKQGGKMRWDYYKKARAGTTPTVSKSFLSDGKTLWAVEHDNQQYFKKDLEGEVLPVAVTFLTGQGDLNKDFTAKLDKSGKYSKTDHVLELTPRQPSAQYKTLWLVVDKDNYRVTQSVVLEASGNTNHFRFYEPNFTKDVKDQWFVLNETELRKKRYRLVK